MTPIRKVMLVDDEPDIRKLGEVSLRSVGKWQVVLCASGAEALSSAPIELPDVILMDVMMPGLDGPATLSALRANPATRAIPVVFMTATCDAATVSSLVARGARGVIGKPFAPMTLPSRLVELLANTSES